MIDEERRRFVTGTGAVVVTAACGCSLVSCKMITGVGDTPAVRHPAYSVEANELVIFLDQISELSTVGGSVKVEDPKLPGPLIVARTGQREFVVASLKCTHYGRDLEYIAEEREFRCVSLGHSEFGLDGALKKGPAEKPLETYEIRAGSVDENKLTILLS